MIRWRTYLVFISPRSIANIPVYFCLAVCIIIGKHNSGLLSLSASETLQSGWKLTNYMYYQQTLLQSCTAYRVFRFFPFLLLMMNAMTVDIRTPRSTPPNNAPTVLPTLMLLSTTKV